MAILLDQEDDGPPIGSLERLSPQGIGESRLLDDVAAALFLKEIELQTSTGIDAQWPSNDELAAIAATSYATAEALLNERRRRYGLGK